MSFHQLESGNGYGSASNYFLRYAHLPGQNIDLRRKDENDPSNIHHFFFKVNDESNPRKKVKACRKFFLDLEEAEKCATVAGSIIQIKDHYNTTTGEIGVKLIALADAFDAKFFRNSNISMK